MKIVLVAINTKYIHSNLAVYALKAYVPEYEGNIVIKEYTINNRMEDIFASIYKEKPDVLCFSVYLWNVDYVSKISKEFHKLCKDVPIWVGGPEVTYEAEKWLDSNGQVTGVMIGEGEAVFKDLCKYYIEPESLKISEIPGVVYRESDAVKRTEKRACLDMKTLPFPYKSLEPFKDKIIYYESSRGCPFSCSYCLSSVEKDLRFKDIETVKSELKYFLDGKVKQVKFTDRTFNCDHKHVMEIWKYIKDHDNGITNFHFEISADLINDAELEMMSDMRPGLIQLEIGVQSTNPETIKEIHRTMNLDKLKSVVKKVQSFGNIHEHLDLIAGLPFEDFETFKKSFNEVYALKPDQLQLGFLKVLKGSFMYENAKQYEVVYNDNPPYEVMSTKWISYDEILTLKQVEEMLEVYYNSRQFEMTVRVLELLFKSPFELYEKLGKYYENQGLFDINHTRIGRAGILLEFLENMGISNEMTEIVKNAITYDIYSRENSKTRPSFADDLSEWKDLTRTWCKNGKLTHLERFDFEIPDKSLRTLCKLPERLIKPMYVLFDYTERDPLDNQAKTSIIDLQN